MESVVLEGESLYIKTPRPDKLIALQQKRWSKPREAFQSPAILRTFRILDGLIDMSFWDDAAKAAYDRLKAIDAARERNAYLATHRNEIDLSPMAGVTTGRHVPYEHQQQAYLLARDLPEFGYFMEQGCVDGDTEFLSPDGWVKIKDYNGHEVAVCGKDGVARFERPEFVKQRSSHWYHIRHGRGLDQLVTHDHRCLVETRGSGVRKDMAPGAIIAALPTMYQHLLCPNTFTMEVNGSGVPFTEQEIRIGIACSADGYFPSPNTNRVIVRLKKQRKIDRFREITENKWAERHDPKTGFTIFTGLSPWRREMPLWRANSQQLGIIRDEVLRWDGSVSKRGDRSFFSKNKHNADLVAYAFQCAGEQVRCAPEKRKDKSKSVYRVSLRYSDKLTFGRINCHKEDHETRDAYCFKTSTSYWIARRNGCTFITGNTGKTLTAILDAAHQWREDRIELCIVVCPNSVKTNWRHPDEDGECEIRTHMPSDVPYISHVWMTPASKENKRQQLAFERSLIAKANRLHWLVINIEALGTQRAQDYLQELCERYKTMMIVDESTRIKTPKAIRTKVMLALSKYTVIRRIMSGTPVIKAPEHAWSQLRFLGSDAMPFESVTAFKKRFVLSTRPFGFNGPEKIEGYQNLDELSHLINRVSFRVLKDECLDLPPKVYHKYRVGMTDEQGKAYEEMRKRAYVYLEEHQAEINATIILVQLLRLSQIAAGFLPRIDPNTGKAIDVIPLMPAAENPKFKQAMEIIEDTDGKLIVWGHYTPQIELFSSLLTHNKIEHVTFTGKVSDEDRVTARERFQNDKSCKVFLGNPAAGGIGLTLTAAEAAIYLSNSFKTEERVQSEDRCHRVGSERHKVVNYHDIITDQSVDEKVLDVLRSNKKLSDTIMGVAWRDWI